MKFHPHRGIRLLAWRILRQWYHFYATLGEDLKERWVWKGVEGEAEGHGLAPMPDYPVHYKEEYEREFGSWTGQVDLVPFWDQELVGVARFIEGGVQVDVKESSVDVWLLPMMEDIRSNEERSNLRHLPAIPTEWIDHESFTGAKGIGAMKESELSGMVVCVEGYLLFREGLLPSALTISTTAPSTASTTAERFVPTPATTLLLRSLALHLQRRLPVLISSPPSSGKASVVRHLWNSLHSLPNSSTTTPAARQRGLVVINLADRSLDSKSLLGSLSSAPSTSENEAGTFVFIEGPLTRAVRQGRWVVLTAIDQASIEVLTVIKVLAERMKRASESAIAGSYGDGTGEENGGVGVRVGGGSGRWVKAGKGFMLFSTRSVESSSSAASTSKSSRPADATFFASHFFSEVWMPAPGLEEIATIVEGRYERLMANGLGRRLIGVWESARSVLIRDGGAGTGRPIGVRDLLRLVVVSLVCFFSPMVFTDSI
jgi:midasin